VKNIIRRNLFNKKKIARKRSVKMARWKMIVVLLIVSVCSTALLGNQQCDKDKAAACGIANEQIGTAPPDRAIVLFDGKDYSNWVSRDGNDVKWNIVEGAMEVAPGTGSIYTKREFGDFRLHIEFKVPLMGPKYKGEHRGNSGVYLQDRYEVQILDSYGKEPGVGDCGAIYGVKPPDRNACKPAEQWQSFDIIFRAARFEGEGNNAKKVENARVTILQNGVVIQNNYQIPEKSRGGRDETPAPGPIMLQDHRNKMQFRNIWIVLL
jgi:hypothetical protein